MCRDNNNSYERGVTMRGASLSHQYYWRLRCWINTTTTLMLLLLSMVSSSSSSSPPPSHPQDNPPSFVLRNDSFVRDGVEFQLIGGSMHYARCPPELWRDRLQRMRAMGLNAVQTYGE